MPPNGASGTALDPAAYYRMRVVVLQLALLDQDHATRRAALVAQLQAQLREVGLSVDAVYRFEDDGCRLVLETQQAVG